MTQDALRAMVEQYSPEVFGSRYSLRVVALEASQTTGHSPFIVRIGIAAVAAGETAPILLRVLVCLNDAFELVEVLEAALHRRICERLMSAVTPQSWLRLRGRIPKISPFSSWPRLWPRRARFAQ
jgi:hypothetical protein